LAAENCGTPQRHAILCASAGELALQAPEAERVGGRHAYGAADDVAQRHRQQVAQEEHGPRDWGAQRHALHGMQMPVRPPLPFLTRMRQVKPAFAKNNGVHLYWVDPGAGRAIL